MFDSEALRAALSVIAHPAFQGVIALLGLIVAVVTAIVTAL